MAKDVDEFFIGAVNKENNTTADWTVKLNINEVDIEFKIDTDAECNVIPSLGAH